MCENHALKRSCYLCVGQKDTGLGLNESPEGTLYNDTKQQYMQYQQIGVC